MPFVGPRPVGALLPAQPVHHPSARPAVACGEVARGGFLSMDFSLLNAGNPLTGPRWLRHKYKWGPSRWPIHWCEAVEQKTLDCGALAALSHEIFINRGVTSFPVQLIHQYSEAPHASGRIWNADAVRLTGSKRIDLQ